MERNQTALVELGLADGEQFLVKIHILPLQLYCLADPEPTDCQQTEQAVISPWPKPAGG